MARLAQTAATLCLIAGPLHELAAQGVGYGIITGVVLTTGSSPMARTIVTLDSSSARAISDSAGAFAFRHVAAGRHTLSARRLGYAIAIAGATVRSGESTAVTIRLEPAAQVLPQVVVRGRKVIDLPRFTAAVERASRNNGAVFTADDIAKENPLDTKSLLERLPGVHVSDRGIMFDRCQDNGMLPGYGSGRGGSATFGAASGPAPRVQVYVDGLQLTRDQGGQDANEILKGIKPQSVAVMEVYTGIARIPGEYLEDACAVIAIWTKAY